MPSFHRLTVPSYFGGLPTGYDYANNAVSGTPANADGAKSGGSNAGTYFVAFGETATSLNANRGFAAAFTNTDYLDNLLRRDLALPIRTGTTAGGVGANNVVLGAQTFLGLAGTTNDTAGLTPYFKITDDSDNDILGVSGNVILPQSLTLTSPDTIGNGFSTNTVTLNFTEAVPSTRNWRVYYATRTNLATIPQDAFTNIRIRGAQEVPYDVEQLFQNLHGNSLAWDAAWTSTVWDLSLMGLNEKYNRKVTGDSAAPAAWPLAITNGVAGSGAWYNRTGPGISGFSNQNFNGTSGYLPGVGWLAGALFGALNEDGGVSVSGLTSTSRVGGETTGFYYLGNRRTMIRDVESSALATPGFASVYYGSAVQQGATYSSFKTYLPAGTSVVFSGGNTITVSSPAYFSNTTPSAATGVVTGFDLLELDFGDGKRRQYVISSVPSTTTATLVNKDGSSLNVPNATTATIRDWVHTVFGVFENPARYEAQLVSGAVNHYLEGLVVADPPTLSYTSGDNVPRTVTFAQATASFYASDQQSTSVALQWGGYSTNTYSPLSYLYADGSAQYAGEVSGPGFRAKTHYLTGVSSPQTFNLLTQGSAFTLYTPFGSGTFTINITNCPHGYDGSYSSQTVYIPVVREPGTLGANITAVSFTFDNGVEALVGGPLDYTLSAVTSVSVDVYKIVFVNGLAFISVDRYPG